MQNSNRNSVAIRLLNNLRNQYQTGGITPEEALKERLALSDVMYAPDLRNNAIQNHPFMQGIGQRLYQLNPQLGRFYGSVYSPLTGDPSGYHAPDAVFNPNNNSYLMDFETEGNRREMQRQDEARQRGEGPTGFAAPLSYEEMTPIQKGVQYNAASFDNPNLINSGVTPADIDKMRVMQGQEPMSLDMRGKLIDAMRNKGYQY